MPKYLDLIKQSQKTLRDAGIDSYILDVQILIGHAFNMSREELFLSHDVQVPSDKYSIFKEMLARRIKREPISHILGTREFWSLDFKVNNNTLDPRADTECLIEAALNIFKDKNKNLNILDLGTGSGCILLTLLKEFKNATGIGVDQSIETALMAKENSAKLGLNDRSNFVISNWTNAITEKFDLIATNPPYIKSSDINNLSPEVKDFDPFKALDGGTDGLDCYREIAKNIKLFLKKDGYLILEIGYTQENDVIDIFKNTGIQHIDFYKDLTGKIRCLSFRL